MNLKSSMVRPFLIASFIFCSIFKQAMSVNIIPVKDPNNILLTFGSCNSFFPNDPNDIFNRISDLRPDVWVWLGDAVYVDIEEIYKGFRYPGAERAEQKFERVKNDPKYKKLSAITKVIGIWDDHDYGKNNAGRSFIHKNITRNLWLDFIDEPKESPRRTRQGIYESYYVGDPTKVKVILLDVRFMKEEPKFMNYGANDILGPEQWEWLEQELKENTAKYVVFGSGVQFMHNDRLFPERFYDWSREKLLKLIRKHKVSGSVILSGDVHFAEIMKFPCPQRVGLEIYEFTSSGMTHYASSHVPFVSDVIAEIYPLTYSYFGDRYFERNFGMLKFSFGNESSLKMEVRNYYGKKTLEKDIQYSKLTFDESILNDTASCPLDTSGEIRFFKHIGKSLLHGKVYVYFALLVIAFVVTIIIKIMKLLLKVFSLFFRYARGEKRIAKKAKQE